MLRYEDFHSRLVRAVVGVAVVGMLWAPGTAWSQAPESTLPAAAQSASPDFQSSDAEASAANSEKEKKDGKAEPSASRHEQPVRPLAGEDTKVKVKEGEDLYKFARHHEFGLEHIAWANGLPTELDVGDKGELTLPERRVLPANPPENGLVINLPERGIYHFQNGKLAEFYPVTIGQNGRFETPTGEFKILDLSVNPEWRVPKWAQDKYKDEVVKPGEDNPLGDRWMGLTTDGLGIHSTVSPMYIGDAVSHGCLRMYPPQARELFEKLEVGTPVRIEYEPVKVGRDEDGNYYLAVFPDVYRELDMKAEIQKTLEAANLAPLHEEDLANLLKQPSGLAERLDVPVAQVDDTETETEAVATTSGTEPEAEQGWLSGLLGRIGWLDWFGSDESAEAEAEAGTVTTDTTADADAEADTTAATEVDADTQAAGAESEFTRLAADEEEVAGTEDPESGVAEQDAVTEEGAQEDR